MHAPLSRLQQEVVDRLVDLMHENALAAGARINEHQLAQQLGVSRTPVRHALDHLAATGFVKREHNRGMRLIALPPQRTALPARNDLEDLIVRIARDRGDNRLPAEFSETEIMRFYDLDRLQARAALERLADLDVVERKPGYGWRFLETLFDESSRLESYRYRIIIETAAIMEPNFKLDENWSRQMRIRHEAFLKEAVSGHWHQTSSIDFFEMNAAFHEGIVRASGNRFLEKAIRTQNQLRRLSNYNWKHGTARVIVNCHQHLEILDRLEAGEREIAAALLRRHLEIAMNLRSSPGDNASDLEQHN